MRKRWVKEFWCFAGICLACTLAGLVYDKVLLFLVFGLAGYSSWHLYNTFRLVRWIDDGKHFDPPVSRGVWGEIFQEIHRLQRRNRKRKKKLTTLVRRFQKATAAMPYATVVLAEGDRIEWWNEAASELLGLEYPGDAGRSISTFMGNPVLLSYLEQDDYESPIDLRSPRNEQTILSAQIVPYGKDQRMLIARDVTQFRRIDQMRRNLVANVSHELRTPLTVLLGYLESMKNDKGSYPESWKTQVDIMWEQANRMHRIVADLLALARLEAKSEIEDGEAVCVIAILRLVQEDARRLSGDEAHRITLDADAELWLDGNSEELRTLFSNLAFNAVRYTPAGGDIEMRWYEDNAGAHFEIQDTGVGIPAKDLPRLTDRFYRVDVSRSRQSGGTGLGLAIVKHVLLRHGGTLDVKSEPGQGAVFRCDFPGARVIRYPQARCEA